MTSTLQEVLAELRELLAAIDEAAVAAMHAQADTADARDTYQQAARGTDHPRMNQAITNAQTATDKAGKTARLLAEAANAFADYINTIAPGTVPARYSAPDATPDGEALLSGAEARARRADAATREQVKSIGDTQDTLENLEKGGRTSLGFFKRLPTPPSGESSTSLPTDTAVFRQAPQDAPDNVITAVAMTLVSTAAAVKTVWDFQRKQRTKEQAEREKKQEREEHHGDQA